MAPSLFFLLGGINKATCATGGGLLYVRKQEVR
jgi:hypothetical protein